MDNIFDIEGLLEYGPLGLLIVAFFEAIFLPVPPDVMLLPLSMMRHELSFWYSFLATFASVSGALVAYFIGGKAGRPIIEKIVAKTTVKQVEKLFAKYGGWSVAIAAFTPVPFKVFALGAGIFRVRIWAFFLASVLGRGARFFLEGGLVFFLGEKAQVYLGRNFEITTLVLAVLVLICIWLLSKVKKS